ncbi:MAG: hypothetical protein QOE63_787 [Acidimicrobiaceae bacterium]|jgi:DNA-binding NarL/FixJ family response regulator
MTNAGVRMARVLIGDFNPVMRLGLRELLIEAGCEVVAEDATDHGDLVDRLARSLPDVLVLDLEDEDVARAVSVAFPSIKVIVCATSGESMRIFPRFHRGESFATPMSAENLAEATAEL